MKYELEDIKKNRPPIEVEISGILFKFVRNILAHFPVFESWNDVWISKELVNWQKEGQTIDRFLKKFTGSQEVKYRIWKENKKQMTYVSIKFPKNMMRIKFI